MGIAKSIVVGLVAIPMSMASGGTTATAKYAGEFMAFGVGGRALAMGSASVAVASDVTAGYWNPAGLAKIDYPQFMLMHDEQFGSLVNFDYAAAAMPMGPKASLGISVMRVGVDNIADTRNAGVDQNGNLTYDPNQFSRVDPNRVTYFNAADWSVYATYAVRVSDDLSYGANIKLIRRSAADHGATGVGFDLGLRYNAADNLVLGANIQDVTTTLLAWDTGRNELVSPAVRLGSVYFIDLFGGRFAPAVDADIRFENRQTASTFHAGRVSVDVHGGLEFCWKELVSLRAGYSDTKQPTLGAGVRFKKISIDYSFAKFDGLYQLDNTHRISVMFSLESDDTRRVAGE
jgi:hypothetical protein